jgi:hypothetical protein
MSHFSDSIEKQHPDIRVMSADSRVTSWHARGAATAAALAIGCALLGYEGDAAACGACFASSSESTIVNDHRMALSISKEHTILWDQISYSGNPQEFAYVIPARPGTRLEPSKETWFSSLDASTRPIIMSPQSRGGGFGGGGGGGGGYYPDGYDSQGNSQGSGGCCSSTTTASAFSGADRSSSTSDAGASYSAGKGAPETPREPVTIVDQAVVGPYETVTLRANEKGALQKWLVANGYDIPAIAGPIIESYVAEQFDFIALRLRPGKDVRAMEPIRIVSPGADPQLPLRLMQIGAGAKIGITLWVITEGRYHTSNFPDATVDFGKLIWDQSQARSNYQELSKAAMEAGDGRGFLTEYADHPSLEITGQGIQAGMLSNPGLADVYATTCVADPSQPPWQEKEAGAPDAQADASAPDASAPDAGDPDAGASDAGDAGPAGDGGPTVVPPPPPWTPKQCDDLDIALKGLHPKDVWITRLRANLPRTALAATLKLEPTAAQTRFDNVHYANSVGTFKPGPLRIAQIAPMGKHGTYALILGTAFVTWRLLRRKKKSGSAKR